MLFLLLPDYAEIFRNTKSPIKIINLHKSFLKPQSMLLFLNIQHLEHKFQTIKKTSIKKNFIKTFGV